jgi:polysaccharide export outer membrane protein
VSSSLESRFRKAGRLAPILAAAFLLSPPALPAAPEEQKQPPPGSEPAAQAREDSISPPPDSFDYVIGVEDVIQISVWKNPDLSVTVPVRPDGKISLPLIDDMQAAGVTPLQLKEDLTRRWKSFLSAPEVSVIIKEVNSFKVFVVGQVAKPGQLLLRGPTRLLQALSLAGGFTNFADSSNIVILSDGGGHEVRREVNYHKVVSGKRPEDNVLLRRGDTVVVP